MALFTKQSQLSTLRLNLDMNERLRQPIKIQNIPQGFIDFLASGGQGRVECCHVHPGYNCTQWFMCKFPIVFRNCLSIYTLVHILPLLIFKYKTMKAEPKRVIKRALINLIRSTLFLTMQVMLIRVGCCFFQKIFGSNRIGGFFAALLAASSIIFEQSNRRVELALYLAPKVIEAIVKFIQRRNYTVNQVLNHQTSQDVIGKICLAIGMGLLSVGCMNRQEFLKSNYTKVLKGLWD
eukprot:403340120